MSNTRQFLLPLNYDITKQVYSPEEIVCKRQYHMDEVKSAKQYHQLYTNASDGKTNFASSFYADKLRRRAKYR